MAQFRFTVSFVDQIQLFVIRPGYVRSDGNHFVCLYLTNVCLFYTGQSVSMQVLSFDIFLGLASKKTIFASPVSSSN